MRKILWVSRHTPTNVQLKELQYVFGNDLVVVQENQIIKNVGALINRYKQEEYDAMVVVLPVEMIQTLVENGIQPIKAVRYREKDDSGYTFTHHHFERITNVIIASEPLVM